MSEKTEKGYAGCTATEAFLVNCDENQLQKNGLESDPLPIPPSGPANWKAVDMGVTLQALAQLSSPQPRGSARVKELVSGTEWVFNKSSFNSI